MYFIPRNNKVYHYIAHTSLKNRYLCTGFFIATVIFISIYFGQRLINVYSSLYAQELVVLQKQYKECGRIETKNKRLILGIEDTKKDIQINVFLGNIHEYFK